MNGPATSPSNQFGSNAGAAWQAGAIGNSNVHIGVIDEGIQTTHPDLKANIWVNPWDSTADTIDNDGNGYINDRNGWDFANNDAGVYDAGE
jgi:subtilisin family serine protease